MLLNAQWTGCAASNNYLFHRFDQDHSESIDSDELAGMVRTLAAGGNSAAVDDEHAGHNHRKRADPVDEHSDHDDHDHSDHDDHDHSDHDDLDDEMAVVPPCKSMDAILGDFDINR